MLSPPTDSINGILYNVKINIEKVKGNIKIMVDIIKKNLYNSIIR